MPVLNELRMYVYDTSLQLNFYKFSRLHKSILVKTITWLSKVSNRISKNQLVHYLAILLF